MYNSNTPLPSELPSSRQLLSSTLLAAIAAGILLVTVVLPAEYGIDPTGIGQALRLTEMGQIKQQLAAQAEADAATPPAAAAPQPTAVTATPAPIAEAAQGAGWRDEMSVTLTPGEGAEIKLRMQAGDKAEYRWVVKGGAVNFDTHGDGGGRSISYEKGRGVQEDQGELVAAFTGNHGWYWRNRGQANVTLVLRTRGTYTDIKRAI
ncbi:transmembrane anchor protein [Hydrogenophaga sp.]|uniref:transmembrane anchor protein n=1 Tax=Hydrogenophaga sp. TaxID=1904254 RepID=UPI002718A5A6|nr:transmembrane anchor protein [Hydrogenophaga sp.]MDO9135934.1 transmembrane anchor protein [Hydrogenophaga sp.]MDP2074403.1 transmembrane anchor protein [Hydrogenophaga sp.]MDP3108227.1 transmembrane anchor protein [Hydrogenophaga sp.]MDP3348659.1 transmembrane anchor protein [Hydrogenophaga sp.]MDZ4280867.1 transmembrane anchor protein [Hydrogenophaga sp.]